MKNNFQHSNLVDTFLAASLAPGRNLTKLCSTIRLLHVVGSAYSILIPHLILYKMDQKQCLLLLHLRIVLSRCHVLLPQLYLRHHHQIEYYQVSRQVILHQTIAF